MQRIVYDIPRWHIFRHRSARGLPLVETDDNEDLRFQDELYDRLFSGERDEAKDCDEEHADWARSAHERCSELARPIVDYCRDSTHNSAFATAWIMEIQQQEIADDKAATACRMAMQLAEEALIARGFDQVDVGGYGTGAGTNVGRNRSGKDANRIRTMSGLVRANSKLRQIALLAGRLKETTIAKRQAKTKASVIEVTSVETGDDIGRLVPSELVRFASARLQKAAHADLLERKLLQYELLSVDPPKPLARGPIVMCLDKSGSMLGEYDIWASAIALGMLEIARMQKRVFALLCFNTRVFRRIVVRVGEGLPIDELLVTPDGGTDISEALFTALAVIRDEKETRQADVVLLSDGASSTMFLSMVRAQAKEIGASIYGVGIGADVGVWCDEAHVIQSLNDMGENAEKMLFGRA